MLDFEKLQIDSDFLYHAMVSNSDDYLYVWDVKQDTFYETPKLKALIGDSINESVIRSKQWLNRVHENDIARLHKALNDVMTGEGTELNVVFQLKVASGEYLWVRNKGILKRDAKTNAPLMTIGTLQILEQKSNLDPITGLMGRDFCKKIFEEIIKDSPRISGGMLLLGLDEFGHINTLNDHLFGDMVLRATVQDLLQFLPKNTTLFRFEGDQFAILGNDMTEENLLDIYEQIKVYTASAHEMNGYSYRFTVSAGLVTFPKDGTMWMELEKKASVALKSAKEQGKNRCELYEDAMLEKKIHDQNLNKCLADSVENHFAGFHLVFQPVCMANSLDIKGAEALLRFTTPSGVSVSPVEFIPLLERSGLIVPVGLWVAAQAIEVCKKWVTVLPDFTMNVNVSYIQLRIPSFVASVEEMLTTSGLSPKNLVLELTESYFITDADNINTSLSHLQGINIQIAMDDFGTGYSSLARLSQFSVDLVKIDRVFVQSIHETKFNYDFIQAVVRLCHSVGMSVCLEGVETAEELAGVRELKADYIQGFYVSRPITEEVFYETYLKGK